METIDRNASLRAIKEIDVSVFACDSLEECCGMKKMQSLIISALSALPIIQVEEKKTNIELPQNKEKNMNVFVKRLRDDKIAYIPATLTSVQLYMHGNDLYCYDGEDLYKVNINGGYDGASPDINLHVAESKNDTFVI